MNKVEELFRSSKLDDVLSAAKLDGLLKKKEQEKNCKKVLIVLAVIGGIALIAGIAYAVYRYLAPTYLDDFEDEFEDDFDEDFFDEEDDVIVDDVFDEE